MRCERLGDCQEELVGRREDRRQAVTEDRHGIPDWRRSASRSVFHSRCARTEFPTDIVKQHV